jgi:hypothetical protein
MVRWLVILVLLGCTLQTAYAGDSSEPTNYCHSPVSWTEWKELLAKHPHDRGLQTLHALRLGICLKVDRGEITLDEGTAIFEEARTALLAQKQEAKRKATLREKPTF